MLQDIRRHGVAALATTSRRHDIAAARMDAHTLTLDCDSPEDPHHLHECARDARSHIHPRLVDARAGHREVVLGAHRLCDHVYEHYEPYLCTRSCPYEPAPTTRPESVRRKRRADLMLGARWGNGRVQARFLAPFIRAGAWEGCFEY